MKSEIKNAETAMTKQPWETPKLRPEGHIGEVVKGGGGKLSTVGGDSGEHRKEKGSGR